MNTLQKEFSRLELGEPAHFRGLTLLPLLREEPSAPEPDYLLLEEAIGLGVARVTELNGGTVPELRFENMADRPVLLLDGEELIGAKQNRVLNLTILAPARQSIVIPVSCVEAGRWNMTSPDFQPAEHLMYSRARAARSEQVTESMRTTGTRRSDQSAVWEEIAAKACRMEAASPTLAMSALFERHAISVRSTFAPSLAERQAGVRSPSTGSRRDGPVRPPLDDAVSLPEAGAKLCAGRARCFRARNERRARSLLRVAGARLHRDNFASRGDWVRTYA
jgi:hypothetical protein